MKTYFRLVFVDSGWAIEYKNGIFGKWSEINRDEKQTVYRFRNNAEVILQNLRDGKSSEDWFPDEEPDNV